MSSDTLSEYGFSPEHGIANPSYDTYPPTELYPPNFALPPPLVPQGVVYPSTTSYNSSDQHVYTNTTPYYPQDQAGHLSYPAFIAPYGASYHPGSIAQSFPMQQSAQLAQNYFFQQQQFDQQMQQKTEQEVQQRLAQHIQLQAQQQMHHQNGFVEQTAQMAAHIAAKITSEQLCQSQTQLFQIPPTYPIPAPPHTPLAASMLQVPYMPSYPQQATNCHFEVESFAHFSKEDLASSQYSLHSSQMTYSRERERSASKAEKKRRTKPKVQIVDPSSQKHPPHHQPPLDQQVSKHPLPPPSLTIPKTDIPPFEDPNFCQSLNHLWSNQTLFVSCTKWQKQSKNSPTRSIQLGHFLQTKAQARLYSGLYQNIYQDSTSDALKPCILFVPAKEHFDEHRRFFDAAQSSLEQYQESSPLPTTLGIVTVNAHPKGTLYLYKDAFVYEDAPQNLRDVLRKAPPQNRRELIEQLNELQKLFYALQRLHQQELLHGALEPESIVLERKIESTANGYKSRTRFCFPFAFKEGKKPDPNLIKPSSSAYAAPFDHQENVGKQVDLWAMTAIGYEVITGEALFQKEDRAREEQLIDAITKYVDLSNWATKRVASKITLTPSEFENLRLFFHQGLRLQCNPKFGAHDSIFLLEKLKHELEKNDPQAAIYS